MKKKKKLTVEESIALLREYKEKYFQNNCRQDKKERMKVLRAVAPTINEFREGKEAYKEISDLIMYHWGYDDAVEVLNKAYRFSRYWPFSLVQRVELHVGDFIATICAIALGIAVAILSARDIRHAKESVSWPFTDGVITVSYVGESYDDETSSTTYSPMIEYTYTVKGKTYTSDRRTYRSVNEGEEWARNVIGDYPKGSPVRVYYKPDNPEFSVLETGVFSSTYIGIYSGYGFIILGAVYFVGRFLREIIMVLRG